MVIVVMVFPCLCHRNTVSTRRVHISFLFDFNWNWYPSFIWYTNINMFSLYATLSIRCPNETNYMFCNGESATENSSDQSVAQRVACHAGCQTSTCTRYMKMLGGERARGVWSATTLSGRKYYTNHSDFSYMLDLTQRFCTITSVNCYFPLGLYCAVVWTMASIK